MRNKIEINTKVFKNGVIQQTSGYVDNSVIDNIVKTIIDTKELQIRKALIALGWTPPNN